MGGGCHRRRRPGPPLCFSAFIFSTSLFLCFSISLFSSSRSLLTISPVEAFELGCVATTRGSLTHHHSSFVRVCLSSVSIALQCHHLPQNKTSGDEVLQFLLLSGLIRGENLCIHGPGVSLLFSTWSYKLSMVEFPVHPVFNGGDSPNFHCGDSQNVFHLGQHWYVMGFMGLLKFNESGLIFEIKRICLVMDILFGSLAQCYSLVSLGFVGWFTLSINWSYLTREYCFDRALESSLVSTSDKSFGAYVAGFNGFTANHLYYTAKSFMMGYLDYSFHLLAFSSLKNSFITPLSRVSLLVNISSPSSLVVEFNHPLRESLYDPSFISSFVEKLPCSLKESFILPLASLYYICHDASDGLSRRYLVLFSPGFMFEEAFMSVLKLTSLLPREVDFVPQLWLSSGLLNFQFRIFFCRPISQARALFLTVDGTYNSIRSRVSKSTVSTGTRNSLVPTVAGPLDLPTPCLLRGQVRDFQAALRRTIDLDFPRLHLCIDSNECVKHLSLREYFGIAYALHLFSSLYEALSFKFIVRSCISSVVVFGSSFKSFIIVKVLYD